MRNLTLLFAAALIAGLAWAQSATSETSAPQATQAEVYAHVRGDGECLGARTMMRTGVGEGDQTMRQRMLQSGEGKHAKGERAGGVGRRMQQRLHVVN